MNENKVLIERNLSRLLTNISRPNDNFAIIGTQDKDNKNLFHEEKLLLKLKNSGYGYNVLTGEYVYDDNSKFEETSYIIYGIPKKEAIEWARELTEREKEEIERTKKWRNKPLNQESIIYKDDNFFGFISTELNSLGQEDKINIDAFSSGTEYLDNIGDSSIFAEKSTKNKNRKFVFGRPEQEENLVKYECYYIKHIALMKSERIMIETYNKQRKGDTK